MGRWMREMDGENMWTGDSLQRPKTGHAVRGKIAQNPVNRDEELVRSCGGTHERKSDRIECRIGASHLMDI